jgi:hypothetical protein
MTSRIGWRNLAWVFLGSSVGACGMGGSDPAVALLPSAEVTDPVAGDNPFNSVAPRAGSECALRYDFAGESSDVECQTEHIGGSPLHWITTCPAHDWVATEQEVELDADGRMVLFRQQGPGDTQDNFSYTYDASGRLVQLGAMTFDQFDAGGHPVHATYHGADWLGVDDKPIPGTGDEAGAFAYDANGRLVSIAWTLTHFDSVYFSETIAYDDAARTRNYEVIIDARVVFPETGVGHNGGYDQFDAAGNIVEHYWFRPPAQEGEHDDDLTDYVYDESGRLLTHTFTVRGFRGPASYVAHHIYDCQ